MHDTKTIIEKLRSRKGYLKTAEVMAILHVCRNTLCKWVRESKIEGVFRLSNGYGFDPHRLADWIEAREA